MRLSEKFSPHASALRIQTEFLLLYFHLFDFVSRLFVFHCEFTLFNIFAYIKVYFNILKCDSSNFQRQPVLSEKKASREQIHSTFTHFSGGRQPKARFWRNFGEILTQNNMNQNKSSSFWEDNKVYKQGSCKKFGDNTTERRERSEEKRKESKKRRAKMKGKVRERKKIEWFGLNREILVSNTVQ